MKTSIPFSRSIFSKTFLLLFAAALLFASCSRKISFATSTVVPAADGKVTMKRDANKNYALDVEVKNLAEPQRLTPAREVYVVWVQTEDNLTRNVGQLISSSGLFTSGLKASLKTVSASKPTRVFITAEDSPNASAYGGQVILSTPNF